MDQNTSKNRKSEAQENFEQAGNAGRFAGNDADAQAAHKQVIENIRQDVTSSSEERNTEENTNAEAKRDPSQAHDYKGESQNVNDYIKKPLNEQETDKARNKATEGLRQGREES